MYEESAGQTLSNESIGSAKRTRFRESWLVRNSDAHKGLVISCPRKLFLGCFLARVRKGSFLCRNIIGRNVPGKK